MAIAIGSKPNKTILDHFVTPGSGKKNNLCRWKLKGVRVFPTPDVFERSILSGRLTTSQKKRTFDHSPSLCLNFAVVAGCNCYK